MTLTLNQFLFLVLTLAVVVAVVFLVMLLLQLRRTAAEAEKAMAELRKLAEGLQDLQSSVHQRVEEFGRIIDASKKVVQTAAQAAQLVSGRGLKSISKIWPILVPIAGFLVRRWKRRKEEKHVGE